MSGRSTLLATTVGVLLAVVALSGVVQAQVRASCTFSLFLLNPNDLNDPRVTAYGVNDNGAVVGSADFPGSRAKLSAVPPPTERRYHILPAQRCCI
jgi:hypothetical protein